MISVDQICQVPAWFSGAGPDADVVVSTRIRVARNLENHLYPQSASLQERKEVFDLVVKSCNKAPSCKDYSVSNFLALGRVSQQYLVEERAVSPELLNLEGDRGLIGDPEHRVNIMVNEEDHLRLTSMDSGYCAADLYNTVDTLDNEIGRSLPFAFDRQRGFLTCCPTNAGTGLRVSFLMHLAGLTLTKTIDQVLQAASQTGLSTRGFFGEHSTIVGNLFQLSNQATMGAREAEFIEATQNMIRSVVDLERKARKRILKEAKLELSDKVHRAYGILRHARTLDVEEFLNLGSALRIGVECGVFKGMQILDLNRLTMVTMPAHIQAAYDRTMDEAELRSVRAEIVRSYLTRRGA